MLNIPELIPIGSTKNLTLKIETRYFPFLDSILNKLKEVTNNLALSTPQTVETNLIHAPLIFALEQMDVQTRAGLFNKWLNAAMPWLDVNVTDQFGVKAEQYKCMIAVAHEKEFQQKFGSEIIACLPIQTGIYSNSPLGSPRGRNVFRWLLWTKYEFSNS